jgi:hypothetical protein
MSYAALVEAFAGVEDLPVRVDDVLNWIRDHTDHKTIKLHPVGRSKKAFRGACRRRAIPTTLVAYGTDYEIETTILYGEDLPEDWRRLVIVKEALHVFDPQGQQVNTPEAVQRLIPAMIAQELRGAPFTPAVNDQLGAFRALAVLLPRSARRKLAAAQKDGTRSTAEIAHYLRLPDFYVDLWLRIGDEIEVLLLGGHLAIVGAPAADAAE